MNKVDVEVFKPSEAKRYSTWLIIAPRNSGKTVLLNDLLYHTKHHYDFCVAMVGTESTADFFADKIPQQLIYRSGYDEKAAEKFIEVSKKCVRSGKPRKGALILDDCVFDKKVMNSQPIRTLHLNGRHFHTTVFMTSQYGLATPPVIRGNVDYVVALADANKENRKKLYKYFFGTYETIKDFEFAFEQITKNYGAMIMDKTSAAGATIKCYRAAVDIPPFKLCKQEFYWVAGWVTKFVNDFKEKSGKQVVRIRTKLKSH